MEFQEMIRSALFGIAVGDALGVPVEFLTRAQLKERPVTRMTEGGIHEQIPGTFSDDSSLTFCQAEALIGEYSLRKLADNFIAWHSKAWWSARGKVFDEGIGTGEAINRIIRGEAPEQAGGIDQSNNGNGSLMRILPLVFYVRNMPIAERYRHVKASSSLTHRHIRSIICCFYYIEYARRISSGINKFSAYEETNREVKDYLELIDVNPNEIATLDKIWNGDIHHLSEESISGDGYVLHSLEASLWCLLTTERFDSAVLKAVNLGQDTDTTGAITGGLAALLYGYSKIPPEWIDALARKEDIQNLAERLARALATR